MLRIDLTWSLKGWQGTFSRLVEKLRRLGCASWHTLIIPGLGARRWVQYHLQSHNKLEASLVYTWACLKKQNNQQTQKRNHTFSCVCCQLAGLFQFLRSSCLESTVSTFLSQERSTCEETKVVYSRTWPLACVAAVHLWLSSSYLPKFYFLMYMSVLHVYLCNAMHALPADARRRCQIIWNWSCLLTALLVLEMELGLSTREECTSNHWAISPALIY